MPYEVEVSLADLVSFRSVKRVRPCHNNNKKKIQGLGRWITGLNACNVSIKEDSLNPQNPRKC